VGFLNFESGSNKNVDGLEMSEKEHSGITLGSWLSIWKEKNANST
jgi:hypothetical protein